MTETKLCCEKIVIMYVGTHAAIVGVAGSFYAIETRMWPFIDGREMVESIAGITLVFLIACPVLNILLWKNRRDSTGRRCLIRMLDWFLCALHLGFLIPGYL